MTPHVIENGSTWLVNCTHVSNSLPPRNPNGDEEEPEDEEEDEKDEDPDEELPVIREPDE
jgi:hypothetical protein